MGVVVEVVLISSFQVQENSLNIYGWEVPVGEQWGLQA